MKAHSGEVGVFVRIRPTANFCPDLIECLPDGQTVTVRQRKDCRKPQDTRRDQLICWSFRLEGVLQDVSQEEVYARVCQRVVLGALDGYNGTLMCFGQTGAGKTYTMTGSTESYKQRGVIPRALQEVFREVQKRTGHFFSVHLSYLDIYNETLVDLLSSLQGSARQSPRGMVVTEEPGRGVFIRGLSLHPVHSEEEALNLLFEGGLNQIIGSHALNRNSSRSHSIFTLHIESRSRTPCDAKYVTSKLNLVDLAGSERVGKTGSEGQMFKEAMYINKSLSFLEQAILALADRRRDHVPFRQTKLTHALKDSLGGNCNTVLVANIYGEAAQIEETLSTLRFASRMKCVRTNPSVNEYSSPEAQIKKLKKEVKMLKEELSIFNTLANRPSSRLSEAQLAEINSQVRKYLDGTLEEISIVSIRQVQAVFSQFKLAVQKREKKEKSLICPTYNSVEKDQSAETAGIKWGSTDDVEEGSFEASTPSQKNIKRLSSAKTKKSKDKQSQSKRQEEASPVSRNLLESDSKPRTVSLRRLSSLPSSTRPKAEAFEDFKVGPGSKINSILKENKTVLLERRNLLRQISEEVNAVKREIDCFMQQQTGGEKGQYPVTEEPDATSLMELKGLYRQRYQVLREMKAEVNYCQHLVDQCRVRLLSEFENWYEGSFLGSKKELDLTLDKALKRGKDNQRPSELDPSSFHSFCNARCRMLKLRKTRAVSSTPVQRRLPKS
ncbi:kinesin-like protein KIF9 isoform X2 [Pungitius pungitius]|uniref:kinesin-like protein KIF9 isoform X2 n=1 Tax=Pungitius pungitius TaxID=134920 RepID=UPI002E107F96